MAAPTPTCLCGTCRKCKDRERKRVRREADPDAFAADRARWREANREKIRAEATAYRRTPAGRRAEADRQRRDRKKVRARRRVWKALRTGRLVKGPCARAGWRNGAGTPCRGRIEAHHADYDKPLEVTWVCVAHHVLLDREMAHA